MKRDKCKTLIRVSIFHVLRSYKMFHIIKPVFFEEKLSHPISKHYNI